MLKFDEPWFIRFKKNSNPTLRFFCFHYAGGSASAYKNWESYLPNEVELVAIQLPGREQRYLESYITDTACLVSELVDAIKHYLDIPYIVFGHSMGAIISYELICEIKRQGLNQPLFYFPSGRQAPEFSEKEPPISHLPDDAFCNEFLKRCYTKKLGSVVKNTELKDFFLPQLRADVQLVETYVFEPCNLILLDCPIVALDGSEDGGCVEEEEFLAWAKYTTNEFKKYRFTGGHFFIESAESQVLSVIRNEIAFFIAKNNKPH